MTGRLRRFAMLAAIAIGTTAVPKRRAVPYGRFQKARPTSLPRAAGARRSSRVLWRAAEPPRPSATLGTSHGVPPSKRILR
jgi:hypothetical protein